MIAAIAVLLFTVFCPSAGAVGLVDDTVDTAHEYSRYPLENYQLDFYVDNGWDWLPWNWIDGIGKQVMYGLYCITNFIWTINLYLSNASGYLVQEAYGLDFISDAADEIGRNIQSIAGISPSGLSADGFYAGFLLLIILIVGAYVAYVGLIKRETTKAVRAVRGGDADKKLDRLREKTQLMSVLKRAQTAQRQLNTFVVIPVDISVEFLNKIIQGNARP